jgi:hypothetical protein
MSGVSPIGIPNSAGYLNNDGTGVLTWNAAVASKTVAAQSIYVDKAATGTGDGTSWTDAFTTIQAAINSLPTVLENAVTIYVRKGTTAYSETLTIQQLSGKGSLTIRGEYYWNGNCATATDGASATKFNTAAHTDGAHIEAGDYVLVTNAYGSGGESDGHNHYVYTTVKSVTPEGSNIYQVELNAAADWGNIGSTDYYTIVKTDISGTLTITNVNSIYLLGFHISASSGTATVNVSGSTVNQFFYVFSEQTATVGVYNIYFSDSTCNLMANCYGSNANSSTRSAIQFASSDGTIGSNAATGNNTCVFYSPSTNNYSGCVSANSSAITLYQGIVKSATNGYGITLVNGAIVGSTFVTILKFTGTGIKAFGNSNFTGNVDYTHNGATSPRNPASGQTTPTTYPWDYSFIG